MLKTAILEELTTTRYLLDPTISTLKNSQNGLNEKFGHSEGRNFKCKRKLVVTTNARKLFKIVEFIEAKNSYLRGGTFREHKIFLKKVDQIFFFEGCRQRGQLKKTLGEYACTQMSEHSLNCYSFF